MAISRLKITSYNFQNKNFW